MDLQLLQQLVLAGEDSRQQFKQDISNADGLASEMVAMANTDGGRILIGVSDGGELHGLSSKDVGRINQLISNTASHHVRSPLSVQTENVLLENSQVVIVLTVPVGIDKPYFDKNGVIWLKSGSDKRRIHSKEELRRLFQSVDAMHADEVPTKADVTQLDRLRFRDFLRNTYQLDIPDTDAELLQLLKNMNLAHDDGHLNLAGTLLFAEHPEWIKPAFMIKAIAYPGKDIDVDSYLDSEDFTGSMPKMFDDALAFLMRNLHKVQAQQGVNSLGQLEVPRIALEELLVNALLHRDYFISAVIRLFIFQDRIEIISPGSLPNHLTIAKIRAGNSNLRNPILASFIAKGLLPYRGLGSGIKRALEVWPAIDFKDDRDGCIFKAVIHRDWVASTTQKTT